jgi:hypothetical protein
MTTSFHWNPVNHYFSGQGQVLFALRDANGNALGFTPVGNCSSLKISPAVTVLDHKESYSGQRAIDKRLNTETKPTVTANIQNWIANNLSRALRGDYVPIAAGSVTAEQVPAWPGLVSSLAHIQPSSIVVTTGVPATLTEYSTPTAAYDYQVNYDAGSVTFNNPGATGVAAVNLPGNVSAVTIGATTVFTCAAGAQPPIGTQVLFGGFTGTNASALNGISAIVTASSSGSFTVAIVTTGDTITVPSAGAFATWAGMPAVATLNAAYSYTAQYLTNSLTQPITEVWLRFEGLNTAESNQPVVVDVFRFSTDPLKELDLISDTFSEFALEGIALADATKPVGSQFFTIKALH